MGSYFLRVPQVMRQDSGLNLKVDLNGEGITSIGGIRGCDLLVGRGGLPNDVGDKVL